MKKLFIIVFTFFACTQLQAQDIAGSWVGLIPAGGTKLHLVFNIKKVSDTGYISTFDSPDQKAFGIACSSTLIKKDSLLIGIVIINGGYKGLWNGKDSITGVYSQRGGRITLNLKRVTAADKATIAA